MEGKALGKGLSALIPDRDLSNIESSDKSDKIAYLDLQTIHNNSLQPRASYPEAEMQELMASIREKGILQPILVRRLSTGGYEVVAGERRLRAARALNLAKVPAIIKDLTNREALVIALVENIQREDLNAIEEAQAFKQLIEDFGYNQEQVAQAVGKDRVTVSNTLRLLNLDKFSQEALIAKQISTGHARALLSLEKDLDRRHFLDLVLKKSLSVRQLEEAIRSKKIEIPDVLKKNAVRKSHDILMLEDSLQKSLGTKVQILAKKKKGKIIIEYYSLEDLDRIIHIIHPN